MRAQVHLPVHTVPELCGSVQAESLHRFAMAPNDKGNRDIAEFSSVQFSSTWYLSAQKIPYALHPGFQKFPQRC